ncbi:MAG: CHRD domain-containing protein [Planctomycetes bacterium]|nr:CHRD domain-containing protein [Planctomycetota bacterium]
MSIRLAILPLLLTTVLAQSPSAFTASLDADQAVPPTTSIATAWAFAQLGSGGQLSITVDVDDLPTASSCELRHGLPGQSGPLVLALSGGPKTWTGSAILGTGEAQAVAAGATHLVLASPAFPGGEIRGQLESRRAQRFLATLDPQDLVPPLTHSITGYTNAFLFEPDNRLVIEFSGTSGVFSIDHQLRHGATGTNGPVLHTWTRQTSQGHTFGESRKLSATEIQELRAGNLYIETTGILQNFTPVRPISRGQLMPVAQAWAGALIDTEVVPPPGVPTRVVAGAFTFASPLAYTARETWTFWVDRNGQWSWGTACNLRHGLPGTNGPIQHTLFANGWKFMQQLTLTAQELQWLENGELYLEVETASGPAARAQIVPNVPAAPSYGGGCSDSNGSLWHLVESRGAPVVGCTTYNQIGYGLAMVAHGPRPYAGRGFLLVGFDRQAYGGLPLPLRLDGYGASPDCYLLTDFGIVIASTNGFTTWGFAFPEVEAFRGVHAYVQALMFDPAAPGFVATTNGLELTIR